MRDHNINTDSKKIDRITDQSGGYNVSLQDPEARSKKLSAFAALKAFGLPIDETFHPFVPPVLFSGKLGRSAVTTRNPGVEPVTASKEQQTINSTSSSRTAG